MEENRLFEHYGAIRHFLSVPTITTDYNHATITLSSQHKRTLTSLHILKNFTNIAYKFADNLIYKSKLKKSINLSIYTATYTIFKHKRV